MTRVRNVSELEIPASVQRANSFLLSGSSLKRNFAEKNSNTVVNLCLNKSTAKHEVYPYTLIVIVVMSPDLCSYFSALSLIKFSYCFMSVGTKFLVDYPSIKSYIG